MTAAVPRTDRSLDRGRKERRRFSRRVVAPMHKGMYDLESLGRFFFPGVFAIVGLVLFWSGVLHIPGVSRGGEKDGVSGVVERYYSAYADGDAATVCGSTSTTSMAQYTRGTAGCEAAVQQQIVPSIPESTRASFAKVHVHEVVVDGRLATAVVSFDGGDRGPVYLERTGERWLMRSLHPLRAPQ